MEACYLIVIFRLGVQRVYKTYFFLGMFIFRQSFCAILIVFESIFSDIPPFRSGLLYPFNYAGTVSISIPQYRKIFKSFSKIMKGNYIWQEKSRLLYY